MDTKINSLARKTALEIYGHKSEADLRYWDGVEADKKVAAAAAIIETALADLERQLAQSEERVKELIGALQIIKRTQPQVCMNGNARMGDPDHIKCGWNVHMIAREAIESSALLSSSKTN